jgi:hypothetical protein
MRTGLGCIGGLAPLVALVVGSVLAAAPTRSGAAAAYPQRFPRPTDRATATGRRFTGGARSTSGRRP